MNLLVTLAHEMVHCKQFAYGELKDVLVKKQLRTFWRGQDYHDVDYWDHPWEFEAFGLETSLAAKFLRDTNLYLYFGQRNKDWNKKMTWLDITQLILLVLACYFCFVSGKIRGMNDAFNFCVNENLVDKDELERKISRNAL